MVARSAGPGEQADRKGCLIGEEAPVREGIFGVAAERLRGQGGQALGLLLKIGLALIVLAIALSQVGPVIFNRIQVGKIAEDAAFEAAVSYKNNRNDLNAARQAAMKVIEKEGAQMVGDVAVTRDQSGQYTVSVTVRKIRRSWLFYRVEFLAPYTEAQAAAQEDIQI
jgi:hypothetical protein